MRKIRAIIIDDEKHSRENLNALIKNYCSQIEIVGETGSAKTAKEMIKTLDPDALFLDINMPKVSGFDLLNSLEEKDFCVVLVTAHNQYGIQAVKSDVVDYLLKPIDIQELQAAEKKIVEKTKFLKKHNSKNAASKMIPQKIIINHWQGFSVLDIENIIRLEADGNYTKIYVNNNSEIVSSKTLKEFEDILDQGAFYRIHKSHLINIKHLKEYSNHEGGYVIMSGNSKVPFSRRRYHEFLERLKDFALNIK